LNEANGQVGPADDPSQERQSARRECRAKGLRRLSALHRHRRNTAVRQEGGRAQLHQVQIRPVARRTFPSKVVAGRSGLSAAERRRQRARARRNVAAENNEDNLDSVSLARRQPEAGLAKREAQESRDDPGSVNLQPRRLLARGLAKREVNEREAKAPLVNLAVSQEAERQLRLSRGRRSRSAERKRERGLHCQGHNKSCKFS
jgi:hypothetical protein